MSPPPPSHVTVAAFVEKDKIQIVKKKGILLLIVFVLKQERGLRKYYA
jgi:hypothetical protein